MLTSWSVDSTTYLPLEVIEAILAETTPAQDYALLHICRRLYQLTKPRLHRTIRLHLDYSKEKVLQPETSKSRIVQLCRTLHCSTAVAHLVAGGGYPKLETTNRLASTLAAGTIVRMRKRAVGWDFSVVEDGYYHQGQLTE